MSGGADRIGRRLVLYVHGLDPRGPGVFHRFQQDAAAEDSRRYQRRIELGRRQRDPHGRAWTIDARWPDGETVQTRFLMLGWDDLVRARWERNLWAQFLSVLSWFTRLTVGGALARGRKGKTMTLAFFALPAAILIFGLGMAAVIALVGALIARGATAIGLSPWLGLLALGLVFFGPPLWRWIDARLNLCWLGRGYRYMVDLHLDRVEGLDQRLDDHARRLAAEAVSPDWDEVLVVGHSSGAINAPFLIGRALALDPAIGNQAARVVLLTLGHSLTGYALMGLTQTHADDLDRLAAADWIPWVDLTVPSDPAASAWPPLAFTRHADSGRVFSRSPRFHAAMRPDAYRALRRDPMGFHFHYMQAADDPALHDWFALIAGPRPFRP